MWPTKFRISNAKLCLLWIKSDCIEYFAIQPKAINVLRNNLINNINHFWKMFGYIPVPNRRTCYELVSVCENWKSISCFSSTEVEMKKKKISNVWTVFGFCIRGIANSTSKMNLHAHETGTINNWNYHIKRIFSPLVYPCIRRCTSKTLNVNANEN